LETVFVTLAEFNGGFGEARVISGSPGPGTASCFAN